MKIELTFVPKNAIWDGSILFDLYFKTNIIVGTAVEIVTERVDEEETKVHVKVTDTPPIIDLEKRIQLAEAIIWFLHLHGLDVGADVRFVGRPFKGGYFSRSDFPVIMNRVHPSRL